MVKMDHLRACEIDQIQRSVVLSTKTAPDNEIYNTIKHDIAIFDNILKIYKMCKGLILQLPMLEIQIRYQEYVENDLRNYI